MRRKKRIKGASSLTLVIWRNLRSVNSSKLADWLPWWARSARSASCSTSICVRLKHFRTISRIPAMTRQQTSSAQAKSTAVAACHQGGRIAGLAVYFQKSLFVKPFFFLRSGQADHSIARRSYARLGAPAAQALQPRAALAVRCSDRPARQP